MISAPVNGDPTRETWYESLRGKQKLGPGGAEDNKVWSHFLLNNLHQSATNIRFLVLDHHGDPHVEFDTFDNSRDLSRNLQ
jgi:hypothetical protein